MTPFCGLETDGMKEIGCTLKFQPDWTFRPEVVSLRPQKFTLFQDGRPSKNVQFNGCKIIRLCADVSIDGINGPMLTVGGPCYYTKNDKKYFEILMRTKEQSLLKNIPPNGDFDWPDYRAFETCPGCCVRAKSGSNQRYWLLIQHLMQNVGGRLAVRNICRLTCEACLETMVEDTYIEVRPAAAGASSTELLPVIDAIEERGRMTWISDVGQKLPSHVDKICMNASDLHQCWEGTGTWKVLENYFGDCINQAAIRNGRQYGIMSTGKDDPSQYWDMDQIPTKSGRKCDGCPNIHRDRVASDPGEKKGRKIRLQECMGCFEKMYCSEACQRAAWPDHKEQCKEVQRKRKEAEEKEREKKRIDEAARMEAALASFVPLSITPQGGGSKKKKGKKALGKKKKGKK